MLKKKILIIEDESSIYEILEFRFKKNGFDVIIAEDGEEGLSKAGDEKPDIIILDLMLPKMSGERVCKEIRNNSRLCQTPIIMLTAKDSDADRVIGKVIGADFYMTKPFNMEKLLKEVCMLVDKKQGDH